MNLLPSRKDDRPFLPASITTIATHGYGVGPFTRDLMAGLTVGVVALPLAMAFAIASGASPERGLFTSIVAGFILSALGGSRFQIGGPTGAFVVIIYSIIFKHGYDGLVLTTLMAGVLLLIFGFFRFGALIKYIPYPVTTGFTAGIAVLIFSSQMKDFFGLTMADVPPQFADKWTAYFQHANTINMQTLLVAGLGLGAILAIRKYKPRIPGPVVGVVLASLVAYIFGLNVETIGSRFGGIPSTMPDIVLPEVTFARLQTLLPEALTIALLAGIESLLSCVVADGMTGEKHNSNVELSAQGAANICSVLCGGIPATGAIARTVTNIRAGAFSPIAGIIHAAVLLAFVLLLANLASYIPLASLAAVLVVVAWDMSEARKFLRLMRAPKSDVAVMCLTFGITVFMDLTVAVGVGVVMASLLFMRRMSEVTSIDAEEEDTESWSNEVPLPDGVQVYTIDGPFFFGVADRFQSILAAMQKPSKVFIVRFHQVPFLDSTAINALESVHHRCQINGSTLLLADVGPSARGMMERLGVDLRVGTDHIFTSLDDALKAAHCLVGPDPTNCLPQQPIAARPALCEE
ncbi:SulP family inorganic anion transporter [Oceanidesulfovibrio marinus]|uniref:Sodium-independent anion transporter n=1 Tax=Oceanidesulfovibrio marinus TaxID=370038 RepID=A0A6P1ZHY5_9BACT|nr:sulfate permease [Oceanidesulfovibrio marinus]TVM33276.1 sodium-independent anion transporter [Oceanidesulfovibrio marinus]